jgi:hypothetical protein
MPQRVGPSANIADNPDSDDMPQKQYRTADGVAALRTPRTGGSRRSRHSQKVSCHQLRIGNSGAYRSRRRCPRCCLRPASGSGAAAPCARRAWTSRSSVATLEWARRRVLPLWPTSSPRRASPRPGARAQPWMPPACSVPSFHRCLLSFLACDGRYATAREESGISTWSEPTGGEDPGPG